MKPARGVSFFRKIEAHDMIGSIVVPQQTVEKLTALQGELLAVGEPEWCDDEDCKRPHDPYCFPIGPDSDVNVIRTYGWRHHRIAPHLKPGSWVLLAPRSWVPTPEREVFAVQTDSILGVYGLRD